MAELDGLFEELDALYRNRAPVDEKDPKKIVELIIRNRVKVSNLLGGIVAAAKSDPRVAADPAFSAELTERLFFIRQTASKLQVKWSLEEIEKNRAAYRAESMELSGPLEDFIYWSRKELGSR